MYICLHRNTLLSPFFPTLIHHTFLTVRTFSSLFWYTYIYYIHRATESWIALRGKKRFKHQNDDNASVVNLYLCMHTQTHFYKHVFPFIVLEERRKNWRLNERDRSGKEQKRKRKRENNTLNKIYEIKKNTTLQECWI